MVLLLPLSLVSTAVVVVQVPVAGSAAVAFVPGRYFCVGPLSGPPPCILQTLKQ